VSWPEPALAPRDDVARGVERALEDVIAVLRLEAETPGAATLLARATDLARSSLFLWLETNLQAQERLARAGPARALAWPGASGWAQRALVMVVLAADLYVGYAALRTRARRWPALVRPRDWQLQHERGARRLLDTATSLGGTLIKAGQVASVRGDLLPEAYVETLASLQDRVPAQPWSVIARTLAAELGRPADEVFAEVERRPLAAASLAQVHRARLRSGRWVALKVQYPDIASLVAADLAAFAGILDTLAALEPTLRMQPILDHLRATLPLELDFAREAREISHLRQALGHRSDVVIPSVVAELSTPRLITMDFVDGIKITDRVGLEQAGIDPRAVARLLNEVYAEQILRLGRLHADPHPGNLLVQPGPRLVLLDHGLTLELRPELVAGLGSMLRALLAADFPALAEALARAGMPVTADTDVASLLHLAGVLLGSGDDAAGDVGRRLGRAIGAVPVELITVGRALTLLSGITRVLDPELDVLDIVARYA
jgi:predicted unusual protein kinase regulating ubiquinone biosynthesis (AarF/ABC1/UbiB family)